MKCKCGHGEEQHQVLGTQCWSTSGASMCDCEVYCQAKPRHRAKPFRRWTLTFDELSDGETRFLIRAVSGWSSDDVDIAKNLVRALNSRRVVLPKRRRS